MTNSIYGFGTCLKARTIIEVQNNRIQAQRIKKGVVVSVSKLKNRRVEWTLPAPSSLHFCFGEPGFGASAY